MAKKTRPRQPQDATLRNVRAANTKVTALDARVTALEQARCQSTWLRDRTTRYRCVKHDTHDGLHVGTSGQTWATGEE